jgi:hypothetical protein
MAVRMCHRLGAAFAEVKNLCKKLVGLTELKQMAVAYEATGQYRA